MSIIIKYIIKNIYEKKFRTFLIIVSITLSSALFFASTAITGTLTNMYVDLAKNQTGKADILIEPNDKSPSNYFRIYNAAVEGVEYTTGEITSSAIYKLPGNQAKEMNTKTEKMHLRGFELEELNKLNPINFKKYIGNRHFSGNQIIISSIFVEKYSYDVNDSIDIEINGAKHRFIVWGIAYPTGLFRQNPQSGIFPAVVPRDTLASLYSVKGRVNAAYVVLEDDLRKEEVKERLSNLYPRYTVREPVDESDVSQMAKMIQMPLLLATIIVLGMSVFIIYTTFKVITVERIPIIGTFRSIGATKKITDMVLMGESLLYGIIGGILGCGLGILILYSITSIMATDPWVGRMDVEMQYSLLQIVIAFILAVVVSLIGSLIPIIKISKIPIKELVLNKLETSVKKKNNKTRIAVFLLILGLLTPRISPKSIGLIVSIVSLLMVDAGVVMFIPHITKGFLKIFERMYYYALGNEGVLAVKNLRRNKSILNNISLLTIGISSLLVINTISYSVGEEILNAYKGWKTDIIVEIPQADRNTEQMIQAVDGVALTYGAFENWNGVELADGSYKIRLLRGIDVNKYLEFNELFMDKNVNIEEVFALLNEGRNILVSNLIKYNLDLEIGDTITLDMKSGNKTYKVVGFYDSLMMTGSNALIAEKYYKADMKQKYYSTIYVKTSKDSATVLRELKDKFSERGLWGETLEEMKRKDMEINGQLFMVMKAFSVLSMIIGIFGVFNNYMISFIERRRSIAVLRSVGISKKQTLKMLFIESLTGGFIGGIIGILGAVLMLSLMPHVFRGINMPEMPMHYSGMMLLNSALGGIIIAVCASISPALKTSKLNIIDAIKYE